MTAALQQVADCCGLDRPLQPRSRLYVQSPPQCILDHMTGLVVRILLVVFASQVSSASSSSVVSAAKKFVPGVNWLEKSVVAGDFTCRGSQQQAILGTNEDEIVVAVFLNGLNMRPEVLRDRFRDRLSPGLKLTLESLDFDPKADLGYVPPGFQRSKTCKGLNLTDGEVNSRHLYWNATAGWFESWSTVAAEK
jgi:hypothetical protein